MKKLLSLAAVSEAAAGLLLLVYPPIVVKLLFGANVTGSGILMSRLAGVSLIALGIACWPGNTEHRALYGMLTYSTLVMLYLAHVGVAGPVGILLWPAVAIHAALSILLVWGWRKDQKSQSART